MTGGNYYCYIGSRGVSIILYILRLKLWGAMEHICRNICYASGYNVCIECGLVQKELIIGAEYIEDHIDYKEIDIKKIKQIDIPRKVMIFKHINKYIKLKMSRNLSFQLQKLGDLQRSSKMIGAGFVILKYLDISEVALLSGVSKSVLKKVCNEIQQALDEDENTLYDRSASEGQSKLT